MSESGPKGFQWRLVFVVMSAVGMAISYALKVNLSIAIVSMVNRSNRNKTFVKQIGAIEESTECFEEESTQPLWRNHSLGAGPEAGGLLDWTVTQESLVLAAYFWGYFVTQIPGGWMADKFGGKWVFFWAIVTHIIPSLLSPACAKLGFEYLIVMRIIEGLGGGVTFPAMNSLVAKWAPKTERSSFTSITLGGISLGTVFAILSGGAIADSWGWEAVFYIHGGVTSVWCLFWIIFGANSPREHRFISDDERDYIEKTVTASKGHIPPLPIRNVFTSIPFWAILIAHPLTNFGWYMFLVELPLFMRTGLGFNLKANALLSSLPFLGNWIFTIIYSTRLDKARQRNQISTIQARKLSVVLATIPPALCLLGVCLSGCSATAVVVFMNLAVLIYGAGLSGVQSNHGDIASNYAGILMGITNMAGTIPGFLIPQLVGFLIDGNAGLEPWHLLFYMTIGVLVLECIVFLTMASAEEQEWNKPSTGL